MPVQFENGRNLTVKTSLQDLDAKEMHLHLKNRSVSLQKRLKCSVFVIFKCLHDAVSKMCRLEFRFQNLPFSKSAGKNVPFSCEREAYPSNFSPPSKCAGMCERSLKPRLSVHLSCSLLPQRWISGIPYEVTFQRCQFTKSGGALAIASPMAARSLGQGVLFASPFAQEFSQISSCYTTTTTTHKQQTGKVSLMMKFGVTITNWVTNLH